MRVKSTRKKRSASAVTAVLRKYRYKRKGRKFVLVVSHTEQYSGSVTPCSSYTLVRPLRCPEGKTNTHAENIQKNPARHSQMQPDPAAVSETTVLKNNRSIAGVGSGATSRRSTVLRHTPAKVASQIETKSNEPTHVRVRERSLTTKKYRCGAVLPQQYEFISCPTTRGCGASISK